MAEVAEPEAKRQKKEKKEKKKKEKKEKKEKTEETEEKKETKETENEESNKPEDAEVDEEEKAETSEALIEAGSLYLKQWANREAAPWKFQKARQVWLLRWMYRGDILAKSDFKTLLGYMVDLKGGARDRALEKACALAKEGEAEEDSNDVVEKANRITFKRARKVVKTLS